MKRDLMRILSAALALLCIYPFFISAAAQVDLYSVEFYWDKAGEDADNGYTAYSIAYGEKLKKPADPEREDKVFLGWNDWYTEQPVDFSNEFMDNVNGRKFYATWANRTYTATFYVDGKVFTKVTNVYGEPFISPRLPEKDGYTFKEWSPNLPQTTPAYDMQFNAVFEPNKYIATFLVDGEVYKQVYYTYGQKSVTLPPIPEKKGFTGEWESYSLVIGGVEINAVYTPNGKVRGVKVDDLKLEYKSEGNLQTIVEADEGAYYSVYYLSSNPAVAEVDSNGRVYAKERGITSVICIVTDQSGNQVTTVAEVTVRFSWWQWIVYILLFGFIWY